MMNYKQFLSEIDSARKDKGSEYALGLVEGIIKSFGRNTDLEMRIAKLEGKLLTSPIDKYNNHKNNQNNKNKMIDTTINSTTKPPIKDKRNRGTIVSQERPNQKKRMKSKDLDAKILNLLKRYDKLDTKNIVSELGLLYSSVYGGLGRLRAKGMIESEFIGNNKQAGLNWSIPEAKKIPNSFTIVKDMKEA